jgi:hypothetical protein
MPIDRSIVSATHWVSRRSPEVRMRCAHRNQSYARCPLAGRASCPRSMCGRAFLPVSKRSDVAQLVQQAQQHMERGRLARTGMR